MTADFSESLVESAWELHQQFAERLRSPLSKLLSSEVGVECVSVERIPNEVFMKSDENMSIACMVEMAPFGKQFLLGIPSPLAVEMVSKLLNYAPTAEESSPRPLTKIEQVSLMQFVDLAMMSLTAEWQRLHRKLQAKFRTLSSSLTEAMQSIGTQSALLVEVEIVVERHFNGNLKFYYPIPLLEAVSSDSTPVHKVPEESSHRSVPTTTGEKPAEIKTTELLESIEELLKNHRSEMKKELHRIEEKVDALIKQRRGRWNRSS